MSTPSASSSLLERLLGAFPEGMVALDVHGTIVYLNPLAARILRLPAESVVGCKLGELPLDVALSNALERRTSELFRADLEGWFALERIAHPEGGELVRFTDVTRARKERAGFRASEVRLGRIQGLGRRMGAATTPSQVGGILLEGLEGSLEADAGFVLGFSASSGPAVLANHGEGSRYKALEFLLEWAHHVPREDLGARWTHGAGGSLLQLPLVSDGEVIGFAGLFWRRRRELMEGEQSFVETVLALGAQALSRAELLLSESVARRRAESSAAVLDAALENIPAGLALVEGGTGRMLLCNGRLERMLGADARRIAQVELEQGQPLFWGSDGQPLPHERSPLRRTLDLGEDVRGEELGYHTQDGLYLRLKVSTTALPGQAGKGHIALAVFEDVTRQRKAEDHLRFLAESSAALARTLEREALVSELTQVAVPQFADWCTVHLQDDSGRLSLRAAAHRSPAQTPLLCEYDGRWLSTYGGEHGWPKVSRTRLPELFQTSSTDGAVLTERGRHPWPDVSGKQTVITVPLLADGHCLGTMTFGRGDGVNGYSQQDVLVAMEVARRVSAALESARLFQLARAERHRAEEANRLKDEFLSILSHELRTPLTSLLGWVQMLRSGVLPVEKHARALETIERNARTQIRLVSDLLEVSGVVTGKLKLQLLPGDFGTVLRETLESVRAAAQAKGVRLEGSCAEGAWVMADPTRLAQVVWNLLHNAVKFTQPGGFVVARADVKGGQLEVTVRDNGEGISPDFLPYVFERFRQEESSSTRRHGGLGLGLAVVKHLTELHGGTVSAASEGRGRGACFTVRLPLAATALVASNVIQLPEARPVPRERIQGLKVLVVDDEPDACEVLTALLNAAGAEVLTASNADEALARIVDCRPDVMLSDIGLPGADGYELVTRLRALPLESGGATPAVALTAYAGAEARARALSAGFNQHLAKPYAPDELDRVLCSVLVDGRRAAQ